MTNEDIDMKSIDNIIEKINKVLKNKYFNIFINIIFVLLVLYMLFLVKTEERVNVEIYSNPYTTVSCVSEYNYKIDKICWYKENDEYNYEIIS